MKSFLSGLGICLILFAVSCTNRNHVSVSDSNLGDTVDVLQNLVFDFSHDLARIACWEMGLECLYEYPAGSEGYV